MNSQFSVYLIDASVYIFRAYFSLPSSLTGTNGRPLNAVYGFAGFLCDFLAAATPGAVTLAFDESLTTSFRNDIYPDYKANRALPPEELEAQLRACRRLAEAAGCTCLASPRFEADDIIGTLAARTHACGGRVAIVSSDKDLTQLLAEGDMLWDYAAGRRLDAEAVRERYGVGPSQMADYLALVGDAVDNIPGVKGIGPKAAATLLQRYGGLESVLANLGSISELPLRGATRIATLIEDGRDQALLSRQLARIVCDMALPEPLDLTWQAPDTQALQELCDKLGIGRRLNTRLAGLGPLWSEVTAA